MAINICIVTNIHIYENIHVCICMHVCLSLGNPFLCYLKAYLSSHLPRHIALQEEDGVLRLYFHADTGSGYKWRMYGRPTGTGKNDFLPFVIPVHGNVDFVVDISVTITDFTAT